jgi:hypothetical protein
MAVTVPLEVIQTGNIIQDRIQYNTGQAIAQLQSQLQPQQSVTVRSSFTLAKQSQVFVSAETPSSVVISLPVIPPSQQQTRITNLSPYPVRVRTVDGMTVFGDVKPGDSLLLYGNPSQGWRA